VTRRRWTLSLWAYRFVILEVSGRLGRNYWRNPPVALDAGQWSGFPTGSGSIRSGTRSRRASSRRLRRVVDDELTVHQRRVFEAIVVDGIPLDTLAAELGLRRNAIYKVIFDTRRKIRRALVANGYLEEPGLEQG
jgi:RNA polymerase sigma-70 factor, ECF subfamily